MPADPIAPFPPRELPRIPELPEALAPAVAAGIWWLYTARQPDAAICTHHGITLHADRFGLQFCPQGYDGTPVVVLDVAEPQYRDEGPDRNRPVRVLINPLTAVEMEGLRHLLAALGHPAVGEWNGAGMESGSLRLGTLPTKTLTEACRRYLRGCPEHGSVFCGRDERDCSWLRDGYAQLVRPDGAR